MRTYWLSLLTLVLVIGVTGCKGKSDSDGSAAETAKSANDQPRQSESGKTDPASGDQWKSCLWMPGDWEKIFMAE